MHKLHMEFEFDPTYSIDPKLLKKRNGKLLIDIQGRLDIFINDRCFFSEPSLALLEFGVALKRWKRKESFYYFTMEHDEREGPILALIKKEESQWSLFSIWQEYNSHEPFTFEVIGGAVDSFLMELDKGLIKNYGIRIDDFV